MTQATAWFRRYADEGRLRKLIWFVAVSAAIALVEWSLSPAVGHRWLADFHISDRAYFSLMFTLASTWTLVVVFGLFNCGWPALVMFAWVKWGLFPLYLVGLIYWACAHGACP
jgi:hypothetical protein